MNSTKVKLFCRDVLKVACRVSTTPTKQKWITAWISSTSAVQPLYPAVFPADFRRVCLRQIYGDCAVGNQLAAGNITGHSVAMLPSEWEAVIATYGNPEALAAIVNTPITTPK